MRVHQMRRSPLYEGAKELGPLGIDVPLLTEASTSLVRPALLNLCPCEQHEQVRRGVWQGWTVCCLPHIKQLWIGHSHTCCRAGSGLPRSWIAARRSNSASIASPKRVVLRIATISHLEAVPHYLNVMKRNPMPVAREVSQSCPSCASLPQPAAARRDV